MIVTAHQVNYLPGLSVVEKAEAADLVVWMDEAQYTKGGYINRNRMPDGSWLTVPVDHMTLSGPINQVMLSSHGGWRERHQRTIRQHYGHSERVELVCAAISCPYRSLASLNFACLKIIFGEWGSWRFQSNLTNGHDTGLSASERLAIMVDELGGDTYLSGPSGTRYLDEEPFRERGITVKFFSWGRPDNPCSLERLR